MSSSLLSCETFFFPSITYLKRRNRLGPSFDLFVYHHHKAFYAYLTSAHPMGRSAFLAFVLAAAAFGPITPASGSPEARGAESAGPWSWEDFPKGDALLVAQVPVTIEPARMAVVRAPAAGRLRLEPALKPDGRVAEGACWAVIEPDDAAAAERELAEAEGRLKLRRENYRKWELPAALAAMDRQIADAGEALAVARLAERSPELFQGDHPALDPASRPARQLRGASTATPVAALAGCGDLA